MRKLLSATALVATLATPALAQTVRTADDVVAPETDIILVAPSSYEVDGYEPYDYNVNPFSTYDDLDDADVYSSITGEEIGEVDEVYEASQGVPGYLEIEVGGFLGIGEKEILLPADQLAIYRGDDGYRVYVEATEEQLEEYPEYDD